jgi:hypothetical protein
MEVNHIERVRSACIVAENEALTITFGKFTNNKGKPLVS